MINARGDRAGRGSGPASSADVLADRIAAALIHHEPGWRLPRLTALARRYSVSAAEVDAAIDELIARHLLRRLPDGQVYRASPAEYQVPLAGLAGLASHVDPMGGQLTCRSRQVSARRVPEDTGRALGLAPGEDVLVIKCLWLVGGEPGALSATYLPRRLASLAGEDAGLASLAGADAGGGGPARGEPASGGGPAQGEPAGGGPAGGGNRDGWPGGSGPAGDGGNGDGGPGAGFPAAGRHGPLGGPLAPGRAPAGLPSAVQLELGPPPPSVARSLRLTTGQSVATVTVRFEDPAASTPVALTMAMLRPDLFRIVVQAPAGSGALPDGLRSAWTYPAEGWEP